MSNGAHVGGFAVVFVVVGSASSVVGRASSVVVFVLIDNRVVILVFATNCNLLLLLLR